jgi:hypothetical protein
VRSFSQETYWCMNFIIINWNFGLIFRSIITLYFSCGTELSKCMCLEWNVKFCDIYINILVVNKYLIIQWIDRFENFLNFFPYLCHCEIVSDCNCMPSALSTGCMLWTGVNLYWDSDRYVTAEQVIRQDGKTFHRHLLNV